MVDIGLREKGGREKFSTKNNPVNGMKRREKKKIKLN